MNQKAVLSFDKRFRNDKYELLYNTKNGLEILQGINGNKDPFSLCLPSLLDIGIMGTCKNRCPFCYQGHTQKPNMKLSDFMSIIDYVKIHTNQVALGGHGDPNKHPHFKEIVEYCRNNNVVPNYTTSGIDLTDNEVEISKICGAVAVSDYEQDYTYKAIQKFIDAGIKTNIHQIFNRYTYNKCITILDGYNHWLESQVHTIKVSKVDIDQLNAVIFLLFKPQGAGKEFINFIPKQYQIVSMSQKILNPKCKFKVGIDSCLANHIVQHEALSETQKMTIDTCEVARMSGYITPDMMFKPCSFAGPETEVSLQKYSFSKVWNLSDSFNGFRDILKEKPNCCPIGF